MHEFDRAHAVSDERAQSWGEQFANVTSHALGLVAALAVSPILIRAAVAHGSGQEVFGAAIFAGSVILLYLASTLYHSASLHRKGFFRMMDHMAIYVLIAGTYTPFALGPLRGALGWTLFGVVWGLAGLGILFKAVSRFRFPYLSTGLYIAMGWLAVFIIRPLAAHLPWEGLAWMVAGGLAYTAGTLFYHWEKMRYSHLIWHLFVLAGTGCHYVAILRYAT